MKKFFSTLMLTGFVVLVTGTFGFAEYSARAPAISPIFIWEPS